MTRLTRNFAANLLGVATVAIVQIVFTPVYVRLLGVETYALIGILVTLQAVLQLLDLGIAATVSREVARYSVHPENAPEARHFVRTFEAVYWLIAASICVGLYFGADAIAHRWLAGSSIPSERIGAALQRLAIVCGLQFPIAVYAAAFRGLQRQVLPNVLRAGAALLSNGIGVGVLVFVSRDVIALFNVFVAIAVAHVVACALALWSAMPPGPRPSFVPAAFRTSFRFTSSVTLMNMVGIAVTQLDKIVVTRLVPLEDVGYYMVGAVVGSAVVVLMVPLFNTLFPAFSALLAEGREAELRDLYLRASQLSAVMLVPTAAVIAAFAPEILRIWTGSTEVGERSAPIAALLIVGFAINGLMDTSYALQLASGRTSIGLKLAALQLVIYIPALYWLTRARGVVGTAAAWPLVNVVYMIVGIPMTHRYLLPGATRQFVRNIVMPALPAILIVVIMRLLFAQPASVVGTIGFIGTALILSVTGAVIAAKYVRADLLLRLRRI